MREIAEGRRPFTLDNLYESHGLDRFRLIKRVLQENGVAGEDLPARLRAFLESEVFKDIPASRIESLMWAVIAQKAAAGQREPPNRGTVNDISVVSGLLPYCDAMFTDNKCRAILDDIPNRYALGYPSKVFSRSSGDEFIDYLQSIEGQADPELLGCVREVYGEDWPTPYLTMYDGALERKARRRQEPAPPERGD